MLRSFYQTLHSDSLRYYATLGIACLLLYAYLVVLVRVTGARTVARLTGFDLIITIALGTIFGGSILFDKLPEGVVALTGVSALHLTAQLLASRFPGLATLVTGGPVTLVQNGQVDERAMRRERVTMTELEAAARLAGCASVADVSSAVLERTGAITVVPQSHAASVGAAAQRRAS